MLGRLVIGYAMICEFAGVAVFVLYAVLGGLIFMKEHKMLQAIVALLICSSIAAALFLAARAMMNCRRWGYWASLAYGLCIAWFAEISLKTSYEGMPNANGEEGWAFLIGIILACGTVVGLVGLVLPSTRREFFGEQSYEARG